MNVEIRTEAGQFPEKEYINGGFSMQCMCYIKYGTEWNIENKTKYYTQCQKYFTSFKANQS